MEITAVSDRKKYMDYLKGVGIFLVIIGHTGDSLYGWIYSFHMGLFFWISGYLLAGKPLVSTKEYIIKKIRSILLPFVGFWTASVAISICHYRIIGGGYTEWIKGLFLGGRYLEITGNFPLWFLQLLFIAEVIFFVEIKYLSPKMMFLANIVLLLGTPWFQQLLPGRPPYHINVLPCALVYMTVGYACYCMLDMKKIDNSIGMLLLIAGWYLSLSHGGNISQINSYWYYGESLCSIIGLYILAKNVKADISWLAEFGKVSLYIMGFHSLLIPYAQSFVEYINALLLIENQFILHMFLAVTLLIFTYVFSSVYVTIKNCIRKGVRWL